MTAHKIFHMASFSRSGETLLQRCLNAHPDIEVVHQIERPDTPEDLALFRHMMRRTETEIEGDHPLLAHRTLNERSVIVVKNATWVHRFPRNGFTLVRNPFALVASASRATPTPDQQLRQRTQELRWVRGIDPLMTPAIENASAPDGFLSLYNRKLLHDRRDGLPFVRYEDFVASPEDYLGRIVAHLGLEWDDAVMRSHENYPEGMVGHGSIKLWRPIHRGSVEKYKSLAPEMLSRIYGLSHEVLLQYGYEWDGETLTTKPVDGML
ncbi:hypothetical protein SAMN05421688_0847 [Poseidonocella pacifica]|uniref:Sulfotransferase family protein n=1 Tax=Poseidonocella pacifica TaxID=871651 RepID=A0A1I0VQL8_9RHOB|nr:sulfotransferase [Poseidonocella pacifica]SFA78293.1 hypothetical protein SAMN05421688_0847 [Poseidonocella pacifica]